VFEGLLVETNDQRSVDAKRGRPEVPGRAQHSQHDISGNLTTPETFQFSAFGDDDLIH